MNRDNTILELKKLLAETYALYLKTQSYHWNVTGPEFSQLHKMFEEHYDEMADAVDEVAERIRMLGAQAPGSFKVFDKLKMASDALVDASSKDMLKDLIKNHELILTTIADMMKVAQTDGDEASFDLGVSRIHVHEKALWMLKSSL